jgi:hypothetical protein
MDRDENEYMRWEKEHEKNVQVLRVQLVPPKQKHHPPEFLFLKEWVKNYYLHYEMAICIDHKV